MSRWFEFDGALVDVLVRETVAADWDQLMNAAAGWGYGISWSAGGQVTAPPQDATAAFTSLEPLLCSLEVGPIHVHLPFLSVDEIEMDIDPREIRTPSEFEHLQEFVRRLGQLLRKTVLVAQEGMHDLPFLAFDPRTNSFHTP